MTQSTAVTHLGAERMPAGWFAADPPPAWLGAQLLAASASGEDIEACVRLAIDSGARLPAPGRGATAMRWSVLSAVAAVDVTAARVLEAHADALAILAEAGRRVEKDSSWGVFAAESGRHRLVARPEAATVGSSADAQVTLDGTKPWCSLGGRLDRALVTASAGAQSRLFDVDLRQPGVRAAGPAGWAARGLRTVVSVPVHFDAAAATPVGPPGWYVGRPGFAWGGIGVAACWHGAAVGLADAVRRAAAERADALTAMHVGAIDVALHASTCTLADAARKVDAVGAETVGADAAGADTVGADAAGADTVGADVAGSAGQLLALRVRSVVADAVERVMRHALHALGPAPLAFDARYAARVADLQLYVRQHHGERDLAALGAQLRSGGAVHQ